MSHLCTQYVWINLERVGANHDIGMAGGPESGRYFGKNIGEDVQVYVIGITKRGGWWYFFRNPSR